jgi:hypothetical protein
VDVEPSRPVGGVIGAISIYDNSDPITLVLLRDRGTDHDKNTEEDITGSPSQ